ncbi:HSP70-like protein [Citrus virus B]|nr:HSP70-like protein [Citrus virus B]
MTYVGFDFGTTYSSVCYGEGAEYCIEIDGTKYIESILFISNKSYFVGDTARVAIANGVKGCLFFDLKRWVGTTSFNFEKKKERIKPNYKCDMSGEILYITGVNYGMEIRLSLSSAIGLYIQGMLKLCIKKTGKQIKAFSCSVPAGYNNICRTFMKTLCSRLGFPLSRVINEPTAAALSVIDIKTPGISVVYDFGGGTFDASQVTNYGDYIMVTGSAGDLFLGGRDIDNEIRKIIQNTHPELRESRFLNFFVEYVKIRISENDHSIHPIVDENLNIDVKFVLDSKALDDIARPLIQKSIDLIKPLIPSNSQDNVRLILVGGTSNFPLVYKMLHSEFPHIHIIKPENNRLSVAIGCHRLMNLVENNKSLSIIDSCSNTLSDHLTCYLSDTIIRKDAPIPIRISKGVSFNTNSSTVVCLFEGNSNRVFNNDLVFKSVFVTDTFSNNPPHNFTYEYDVDNEGNVSVVVRHTTTTREIRLTNELSDGVHMDLPDVDLRQNTDAADILAEMDFLLWSEKHSTSDRLNELRELFSEDAVIDKAQQWNVTLDKENLHKRIAEFEKTKRNG